MLQNPKLGLIHVFLALYGPPVDTEGLGSCLIILEPQFNQDWEEMLHNLGFKCVFDDLDGYPAVFVPLKSCMEINQ